MRTSPAASRRMVSADSCARSARLSTIRYSSARMDRAAAHAHRVDHRHAAGGDVVAVADAAGRPPADRLAELGAAALDQREQLFRRLHRSAWAGGRSRRGRGSGRHAPQRPSRCASSSAAWARRLRPRSWRGRMLTRSTAWSGTTLFGPPPSIRAGLTDSPGRFASASRSARSAAATIALRPSSGLRPAWAAAPLDEDREIAAARPRAGERAVGQRGRLVGQRRPCRAPPRRSAPRSRASRPPRRC